MKKSLRIVISLFFLLIFVFVLTGCSDIKEPEKEKAAEEVKELSFETISKDFYSEQLQRENYVIENEESFSLLWKNVFPEPGPDVPDVDFEKYMVIAVFQGQKNTGRYEIEITQVLEGRDSVSIYISEISPASSDIVVQVLTSPYHIIKIERTEKDIIFKST